MLSPRPASLPPSLLCPPPQLLSHPQVSQLFPPDVIERARVFLAEIPGGLGAYSDSAGALMLRKQIAAALQKRDGFPASPDELYLTVRERQGGGVGGGGGDEGLVGEGEGDSLGFRGGEGLDDEGGEGVGENQVKGAGRTR